MREDDRTNSEKMETATDKTERRAHKNEGSRGKTYHECLKQHEPSSRRTKTTARAVTFWGCLRLGRDCLFAQQRKEEKREKKKRKKPTSDGDYQNEIK
jgi:hypothetical protein